MTPGQSACSAYLMSKLPEFRHILGISASELCRRISLSRHAIDTWETGSTARQRPVPFRRIAALAHALLVDEHRLLHGTGSEASYQVWLRDNGMANNLTWCVSEPPDGSVITDEDATDSPAPLSIRSELDSYDEFDVSPDKLIVPGFVHQSGWVIIDHHREIHVGPSGTRVVSRVRANLPMPFVPSPGYSREKPGARHASVSGSWHYGYIAATS